MTLKWKINRFGQSAIYDPATGDAPLTDPRGNLDLLKWGNELEHVGIVEIRDYTVTLPASGNRSPPREVTYVLDTHDQPAAPFVYGYVTLPDGGRRPFAMHAVIDRSAGTLAGFTDGYLRQVSLGIDGPNIVLHEWARASVGGSAYTSKAIGVRVFITDLSLEELGNPIAPAALRDVRINSAGVQLGPFDATKRWLRIAEGEAQFPLINGVTFDGTDVNWRYRIPASSQFAYTISFGSSPDVNTATAVDVTA